VTVKVIVGFYFICACHGRTVNQRNLWRLVKRGSRTDSLKALKLHSEP